MGDEGKASEASAAAEAPRDSGADRRDSDRIPVRLLVRETALGGSFEERPGNLSIGGVFFDGLHPPVGTRFELRFLLHGVPEEVHAVGEVLRISRDGPRFGAHLKFVEIPLEAELAIARVLQR